VLEWQTFDIDFDAPRFDASGKKIANAKVTLLLNGEVMYKDQDLGPVILNAAKLGEGRPDPSNCRSMACHVSSEIFGW
jgi:hypothetical protein